MKNSGAKKLLRSRNPETERTSYILIIPRFFLFVNRFLKKEREKTKIFSFFIGCRAGVCPCGLLVQCGADNRSKLRIFRNIEADAEAVRQTLKYTADRGKRGQIADEDNILELIAARRENG